MIPSPMFQSVRPLMTSPAASHSESVDSRTVSLLNNNTGLDHTDAEPLSVLFLQTNRRPEAQPMIFIPQMAPLSPPPSAPTSLNNNHYGNNNNKNDGNHNDDNPTAVVSPPPLSNNTGAAAPDHTVTPNYNIVTVAPSSSSFHTLAGTFYSPPFLSPQHCTTGVDPTGSPNNNLPTVETASEPSSYGPAVSSPPVPSSSPASLPPSSSPLSSSSSPPVAPAPLGEMSSPTPSELLELTTQHLANPWPPTGGDKSSTLAITVRGVTLTAWINSQPVGERDGAFIIACVVLARPDDDGDEPSTAFTLKKTTKIHADFSVSQWDERLDFSFPPSLLPVSVCFLLCPEDEPDDGCVVYHVLASLLPDPQSLPRECETDVQLPIVNHLECLCGTLTCTLENHNWGVPPLTSSSHASVLPQPLQGTRPSPPASAPFSHGQLPQSTIPRRNIESEIETFFREREEVTLGPFGPP